jgi:hypothetical protein
MTCRHQDRMPKRQRTPITALSRSLARASDVKSPPNHPPTPGPKLTGSPEAETIRSALSAAPPPAEGLDRAAAKRDIKYAT